MQIALSVMDTQRWGVMTARANNVTRADLPQVRAFCAEKGVKFLIARAAVEHLDAVQTMEDDGFRLMDTLVYYAFKFGKKPLPDLTGDVPIRFYEDRDRDAIEQIARHTFTGYYGHYHADPRLDNAKADAVYLDWSLNSLHQPGLADAVIVADDGGTVLGFVTLRRNSPQEAEIVVGGVAPEAQRRGIYRDFIAWGTRWAAEQSAARMVLSTQITNVAVQKVWARLGYEADHAFYTLHKWFD